MILGLNYSSKIVFIGKNLYVSHKKALLELLMKNKNVFAYSHDDMLGIDRIFICHNLNVSRNAKPVREKKYRYSTEVHEVTDAEVKRLLSPVYS